jgi:hypothetical protein
MRPIFTIHAGEYLAATEIEKRFRHLRVWIPSKDTGIDLLVTDDRQNKVASLQVKFSKDYLGSAGSTAVAPGIASSGWWTFQRAKIAKSPADFWALTLYQFQSRKFDFVIVPPQELLARYERISPAAKAIQSYFCVTAAGRCWEVRGLGKSDMAAIRAGTYANSMRDFSAYLNAWPFKRQRKSNAV